MKLGTLYSIMLIFLLGLTAVGCRNSTVQPLITSEVQAVTTTQITAAATLVKEPTVTILPTQDASFDAIENTPTPTYGEITDNATLPKVVDFDLPEGWSAQQIFKPVIESPNFVAVSPFNEVLFTLHYERETLYQISDDGSLSIFARIPNHNPWGVAFDSLGRLYVSDYDKLWQIDRDGSQRLIASDHPRFAIDVAPNGDIFSVANSTSVLRTTPDGETYEYASGFVEAFDVAVSPVTGAVFVVDSGTGQIYQAYPDGIISLIVGDLTGYNHNITFSPDGALYHNDKDNGRVSIVNINKGRLDQLPWIWSSMGEASISDIAIDHSNGLVAIDPTFNSIFRYDLETKNAEVLHWGQGNNGALAVNPITGKVHLGVGHPLKDGQGKIVAIEGDGTTSTLVELPDARITALVFDSQGIAYIATVRPGEGGSHVYRYDNSGSLVELFRLANTCRSLAVHPTTDQLWGVNSAESGTSAELWWRDDFEIRNTKPLRFTHSFENIAFSSDGLLYMYANTSDMNIAPVSAGIFRFDSETQEFTLVADLTTESICCIIGFISIGADGNIYWVGRHDRLRSPYDQTGMYMFKITLDGEVSLFGVNLPIDPSAITSNVDGSILYFASAGGVFQISP